MDRVEIVLPSEMQKPAEGIVRLRIRLIQRASVPLEAAFTALWQVWSHNEARGRLEECLATEGWWQWYRWGERL